MTDIEDHAAAVIRLTQNISNLPAKYRARLFDQLETVVVELLRSQKSGTGEEHSDDVERKLTVFMRALTTYPADRDEWLQVFKAFSKLLIKEVVTESAVVVDADEKLREKLRANHRFRFVEDDKR